MAEGITSPKHDLILQAALKVFGEKGFYRAKIEDIAQEAGVGKGTVYEYFKSKEHLFREILNEGKNLFTRLMREEINKEATIRQKLENLVRLNIEAGQRYRALARIAMLEATPVDHSFRQRLLEMHTERLNMIEEIIAQGIAKKEIRPVNARIVARLFYGGLGLVAFPFVTMEISPDEIERIASEIIDYYMQGIAAE